MCIQIEILVYVCFICESLLIRVGKRKYESNIISYCKLFSINKLSNKMNILRLLIFIKRVESSWKKYATKNINFILFYYMNFYTIL